MAKAANENFQVSATGGAGSKGQPAQYMASDYERTGDAGNMELQTSAPMSQSGPVVKSANMRAATAGGMGVTPLSAFTERLDEHPATGAPLGPGAGSEVLASPGMLDMQSNEDLQKLAAFMPVYAKVAESPRASNATRNFYRWMRANIQ